MRFPALAIAGCIAAGIAIGGSDAARLPQLPQYLLVAAAVSLLLGVLLLILHRHLVAGAVSLLAWMFLGAAAAQLAPMSLPLNHVARLSSEQFDLAEPLRWQGQLRADPLPLPWGRRFEVNLAHVQRRGTWMDIAGGMRLDYYEDSDASQKFGLLRAGDHVEFLVRARTPRNFGNPGAFDHRGYLARQAIHLTGTLRSPLLIQRIDGPTGALHWVPRIRGRLLQETHAMFGGAAGTAAVARAMLLGDRSFVDREEADAFRETGVYHILVLSGMHVAILAGLLLWVGARLRLSVPVRIFLALIVVGAYVAIVDDQPPILRAWLMITAYLLGAALFRSAQPLNALGVAAALLLLAQPSALHDASFQLSFAAVGMIAGIAAPLLECSTSRYRAALAYLNDTTRDAAHAPRFMQFRLDVRAIAQWLGRRAPVRFARFAPACVTSPIDAALRLFEIATISLVIQIGILPLMTAYFHRVTVVGPVANLPAALLTGIIVPLGYVALGAHLVWGALGQALATAVSGVVHALSAIVEWMARWDWASFRTPSPPDALVYAFYIVLAVSSAALIAHRTRIAWLASAGTVVLAATIAIHPFAPQRDPQRLEATLLDVGQGDAAFIGFPGGRTMLVDGGGLPGSSYESGVRSGIDVGEEVISPYLWSRGIKRIDTVVLTHAHQDHLGGLAAILRNFSVGELWIGREADTAAFRDLVAEAKAHGVAIVQRRRGDAFDWGNTQIRVLWPPADTTALDSNNDSIVLRISRGQNAILLAGDIERHAEGILVADDAPLAAGFLKVAHHGSRTSSTEPFLDMVRPRFAAVSVGENNPFGHPNAEVVERIESAGGQLLRTDRDGAITTLIDSAEMRVRAFLRSDAAGRLVTQR